MPRNAPAGARGRVRNRYERTVEQSPNLLAQLQDAAQSEIGLRDESALARTLLDLVLGQFAQLHARNGGVIEPNTFLLLTEQLKQVQRIIKDAADIEAKRDDQRLSATHVLLLIGALRDDLVGKLGAAFGPDAATVVEDAFARAKWPDSLDENTMREALSAPAAYKVQFRIIDKGSNDEPREGDESLDVAQLAEIGASVETGAGSPRNVGAAAVTGAVAEASVANVPRTQPRSAPTVTSAPQTMEVVANAKLARLQESLAQLTQQKKGQG